MVLVPLLSYQRMEVISQHPDVSHPCLRSSLPQQQAVGEVPQESAVCGGTQLMPTDTGAEGGFGHNIEALKEHWNQHQTHFWKDSSLQIYTAYLMWVPITA